MREIKFRAWDKEEEMLLSDISLIDDTWDMLNEFFKYKKDELVFMHYTGLKDNIGKGIYEGDILDGSYTNPLTKEVVKKYYQIVYENGCYNAHAKNHPFGSTVLYFINTKSKVIGNIYENPELLEDADD